MRQFLLALLVFGSSQLSNLLAGVIAGYSILAAFKCQSQSGKRRFRVSHNAQVNSMILGD